MYGPRLKHLKERNRNEFFPGIVIATIDIGAQASHGLIIIFDIEKRNASKSCSE
jgi:hypothetical protein